MGKLIKVLLAAYISLPLYMSAQTPPVRDAQALSILSACVTASGGPAAVSQLQDLVATGDITYKWANEDVKGTVTLKARGTAQFRTDALLASGTRSWATSGSSGILVDTDGSRSEIPFYNAINVGILNSRLPNIFAALNDETVSVTYVGLVQVGSVKAQQVHVQYTDDSNPDPMLASIQATDYYFDPDTALLLQTVDSTYSTTSVSQPYVHTVAFSEYKAVQGVLMPFSITETISQQVTWSIELSNITFNVGLGDSDFKL